MRVHRTLPASFAAIVLSAAGLGACATLTEEDQAMISGARSDAQRAEAAANRAEAAADRAETAAAAADEAYNRMLSKP